MRRLVYPPYFFRKDVKWVLYKVGLFDGNPSEQVPSDIVRLGCFSELIPITMPEIESASPASPGQRRAKEALATTGFMPVKFKAPKFE